MIQVYNKLCELQNVLIDRDLEIFKHFEAIIESSVCNDIQMAMKGWNTGQDTSTETYIRIEFYGWFLDVTFISNSLVTRSLIFDYWLPFDISFNSLKRSPTRSFKSGWTS